MTGFHAAGDVWSTISALSSRCRTKRAAVAYVTSDVIVKFGHGDLLVVDASDDAVAGGQTSGSVIQRALTRGARVVSVPQLHAKVIVFDQTAVVGSPNVSVRSARHLIEAVMVTEQKALVRQITRWIDNLGNTGQTVDDILLRHLLSLESRRPPIRRAFRALAESHTVFFKQVMAGDIEKYKKESSFAGTGGGARDLRVSPASVFRPLLSQMLSEVGAEPGVTHGRVVSSLGQGRFSRTLVELWPPTNARPNELRIARFYEVPGWAVQDEQFKRAMQRVETLFYVLEMDIHGTVTAKVLSGQQVSRDNKLIGRHIENLASRLPQGRSIIGAVDVILNITVP